MSVPTASNPFLLRCMSLKVARLCRPGRVTARRLLGHYCRAFSEVARHFVTLKKTSGGPKSRSATRSRCTVIVLS